MFYYLCAGVGKHSKVDPTKKISDFFGKVVMVNWQEFVPVYLFHGRRHCQEFLLKTAVQV